jgi:integrase family protein with SAM-like domain
LIICSRYAAEYKGVSGECRAQRLVLAGGERLWTVLGGDHRPVGPAEEFLEYLRVQRVSSNTVKSYAHALALWWQYLQVFGLSWDAVTLEAVGGFLAWLRTGDGPRVVSIEQRPARFAESTIAARLQAVVSCYRYHQFNGWSLAVIWSAWCIAEAAATSRCWSMPPAARGAARR